MVVLGFETGGPELHVENRCITTVLSFIPPMYRFRYWSSYLYVSLLWVGVPANVPSFQIKAGKMRKDMLYHCSIIDECSSSAIRLVISRERAWLGTTNLCSIFYPPACWISFMTITIYILGCQKNHNAFLLTDGASSFLEAESFVSVIAMSFDRW